MHEQLGEEQQKLPCRQKRVQDGSKTARRESRRRLYGQGAVSTRHCLFKRPRTLSPRTESWSLSTVSVWHAWHLTCDVYYSSWSQFTQQLNQVARPVDALSLNFSSSNIFIRLILGKVQMRTDFYIFCVLWVCGTSTTCKYDLTGSQLAWHFFEHNMSMIFSFLY